MREGGRPDPGAMDKDEDGRIELSRSHPIGHEFRHLDTRPEPARWAPAPEFSAERRLADPVTKRIGWWSALRVLIKASRVKRDDREAQLGDIEEMIVAGHARAAIGHIERLAVAHPDYHPRCLGLLSLALYDLGREPEAIACHREALIQGGAHRAMIEMFGIPPSDGNAPGDTS